MRRQPQKPPRTPVADPDAFWLDVGERIAPSARRDLLREATRDYGLDLFRRRRELSADLLQVGRIKLENAGFAMLALVLFMEPRDAA